MILAAKTETVDAWERLLNFNNGIIFALYEALEFQLDLEWLIIKEKIEYLTILYPSFRMKN